MRPRYLSVGNEVFLFKINFVYLYSNPPRLKDINFKSLFLVYLAVLIRGIFLFKRL